jgi:hypothetical protein
MSVTRRHPPNEWLWSTDIGAPTDTIRSRLGLDVEPTVEFSADGWRDEHQALEAIQARLAPYAGIHARNWNSVADGLLDARDSGLLIVVRDIYPSAMPTIGLLVNAVAAVNADSVGSARLTVVLEGWPAAELTTALPIAWEFDIYEVARLPGDNS